MPYSLPPAEAIPHIERESAGYITGRHAKQRSAHIKEIWHIIRTQRDHYRAPGHRPVSSPVLVKSSKLKKRRSELHIDDKPGRHIIYMDSLCLAFRRAGIQCRLEVKQSLKKSFAEVTIKIGDKAKERMEEAIPVNLQTLEKKGFQKALGEGIKQEIKEIADKKGFDAARHAQDKYKKFKRKLSAALKQSTGSKLGELTPYALIHLHRSTIEANFSPGDDVHTEMEVKTDECEYETVLGHQGEFAQIEFEHIKGNKDCFRRELERLMKQTSLCIEETSDSKEDHGMRQLAQLLLPQDNSPQERARVDHNRSLLAPHLGLEFISLGTDVVKYIQQPTAYRMLQIV